jgi:hypothetical protein
MELEASPVSQRHMIVTGRAQKYIMTLSDHYFGVGVRLDGENPPNIKWYREGHLPFARA